MIASAPRLNIFKVPYSWAQDVRTLETYLQIEFEPDVSIEKYRGIPYPGPKVPFQNLAPQGVDFCFVEVEFKKPTVM